MNDNPCTFTTGDYSTLEALLVEWSASNHPLTSALRRKLNDAKIVFQHDLTWDIASLGSSVGYSIGDREVVTHTLTRMAGINERWLPISIPLGLAILGRRQGDEVEVTHESGLSQRVMIHRVFDQPENNWPNRFRSDPPHTANFRVISNSSAKHSAGISHAHDEDDDPGPTAA